MAEVKVGAQRGPPLSSTPHPYQLPDSGEMKEGGGYGSAGGVGIGSAEEALRVAAGKGQADRVRDFLQTGVDLTSDQEGRTALHYAAHNGHQEVCRLLINHGCPLDLQDSGGYTAVQRACSQGQVESLETCLQMGCSVNLPDQHGNTALHEAAWHGYSQSVELLIQYNANVFATNKSGFTALHLAAQNGHNESSRVLLYGGIDPDLQNNYGDTALHTAARYGHAGVTRILISAKCQLNLPNKNGDTCLHIAAALKRRKIAKILVEAHADVHIHNKQNETAVDVARRKDNPEIVLIINSLARSHSVGVKGRGEAVGVTFKDDVDVEEGPVVCPEEDPPHKPDKPEKERGFFAFFKKKKKDKDRDSSKDRGGKQPVKKALASTTTTTTATTGTGTTATQGPTPPPPSGPPPPPVRRVSGFFSQYVPQPGTQYYRDLAGNIKQGPVGYSPVCHCRPVFQHIEQTMQDAREKLYDHINSSHQVLQERIRQLDRQTSQQQGGPPMDPATRQRLEAERRACRAALEQRLQQERQTAQRVVQSYGQELHSQVQGWLEDHLSAYGHCLDHHHDDTALPPNHIFTDIHLGPHGGRLFRSRSDETLSASDNSGKGRKRQFYESRRAAMEQIRGWKVPAAGKKGASVRRRERGQSAESLDRREGAVREEKGVGGSAGRVITVAADVHHSCDKLADTASPSRPGPQGGDVREGASAERWQDGSNRQVFSGRHSPAFDNPPRSIQHPPHAQQAQPPSYPPRPPSRQLHAYGNPSPQQSGQWGSSVMNSGQIPPDAQQRLVHNGTRESRMYERSRYSSHQRQQTRERVGRSQQGLDAEDSVDFRSVSPSRMYSEDRFSQPVHSAYPTSATHHRHGVYNPRQEDSQRWSTRARSSERILDGGEGAGGKRRSRSEERVLDSTLGQQQQQRSSAADDHSGYVTDSAMRSAVPYHSDHNHVSYSSGLWKSNSSFSATAPVRTDMDGVGGGSRGQFVRNSRPNVVQSSLSKERTVYSSSHDRGVAGDPYSGYYQQGRPSQQNSSQQYSSQQHPSQQHPSQQHPSSAQPQQAWPQSSSYQPPPRVQPSVGSSGVHFSAPDTTRPKTPTDRDVSPYTTVIAARTDKSLPSEENAHSQCSSETRTLSRLEWSDDAPVPVQHFSTFKPLSDRILLQDTRRVQHTDGSTARVSDKSKPTKEQGVRRESAAQNSVSASSGRTYSPRSQAPPAGASQEGDVSPRAEPVSSGHYSVSGACLRHGKELSYSPVEPGDSKEDSTCSSNQDSGYSSRLMTGLQGKGDSRGEGGRGADSTTPSSSFSTDHSLSAGTPSTAGSPYMHLAGHSYADYVPMGAHHPSSTQGSTYGHTPRSETGASQTDWQPRADNAKTSYRPSEPQQQTEGAAASRRPSSQLVPGQPSTASFQRQVQGWYHHKLLEAAQRLRYSQQYGQAGDSDRYNTASSATGVRFDPVHGSDV